MGIPILVLAVAGYAAVATAYGEARRRGALPPAWARHAGLLVVAAHLAGLIALSTQLQRSPLATSSQSLSFLAFALTALYVILERTSRVASHGGGFYALAALLAALSVPGLVEQPLDAAVPRAAGRTMHVGLSLLSSAAVFAAALLAVAYLAAYRRMKQGAPLHVAEGPSLIGLERLACLSTLLALLLLLPALIVGFGVEIDSGPAGWMLTATSGALFVLMSVAFLIWWRRPRQGARAAWITLVGAVLLIVAAGIAHPLSLPGGAG